MNDEQWLTADQASQVLKVVPRQVHRYGTSGRIRTRKSGRRVLYNATDVARLADELQVDLRPVPRQTRDLEALDRAVSYIRDRDQEYIGRLDRIEARLNQPAPRPGVPWVWLVAVVAVALGVAIIAVLLLR